MEVEEGLVVTWRMLEGSVPPLKALSASCKDLITAWTLSPLKGGSVHEKVKCCKVSAASGVLAWGLWLFQMDQSDKVRSN